MPGISASRKTLHWWGEDLDGRITHYQYRWGKLIFYRLAPEDDIPEEGRYYRFNDTLQIVITDTSWDNSEWIEDRSESKEFVVPIRSDFDIFTFQVKAVDNIGLEDPTPAMVSLPVKNLPPEIEFRIQSNPLRFIDVTYYTFPVRTFIWDGSDPDGNETLQYYYYALDPADGDTNWMRQDAAISSVTLEGEILTAGAHIFWAKAEDTAGFQSNRIHFPDSTVQTDPAEWVVKAPLGEYLIVDDYALDRQGVHLQYYKAIFEELVGAENVGYSVWRINNELPFSSYDVTTTLRMFKRIYWYSYYEGGTLSEAFNAMYTFINTPGNRMVLSASEIDTGMWIDVAADADTIRRLSNSPEDTVRLIPESDPRLPILELAETIGRPSIYLEPAPGAEVLYRLDEDTRPVPRYTGHPAIVIRRPDKSYTLISIPLYTFRELNNLDQVFRVLFDVE